MTAGGSARGLVDGRFELLERLGGGGMGLVWRARASGTQSVGDNAAADSAATSPPPADQGTGTGAGRGSQLNLLTPAGARSAVSALKRQIGSRKIVQFVER